MWVCVAKEIDEVRVTNQILAQVRSQEKHRNLEYIGLNALKEELVRSLDSKRFLMCGLIKTMINKRTKRYG
jgi:hypothetical protein